MSHVESQNGKTEKIELNAEKSDKKETGNPAAIEQRDQGSDREVEAMAYLFVCMSIVWWWTLVLSRELVTTIGEQDHQLAENELPSKSTRKEKILCPMHQSWLDGQNWPEESKPYTEITGKEPELIESPDPEVEPDKKPTPPPTNPHHEIPLDQFPKELKLAEFGKEEVEENMWEEDHVLGNESADAIKQLEQNPDLKADEPEVPTRNEVPEVPIAKSPNPIDPENKNDDILYPSLKELIVAELGKQELDEADPIIDEKKANVEKEIRKVKHEIEKDNKLFVESDKDSPQLGNIPSKNLKLERQIILKICQPSPLPEKDWYFVVRADVGGGKVKKFKYKRSISNVDEWSTPVLSFDVKKKPDDGFYITLEEKKKTTFGFKSNVIACSGWLLPKNRKLGTHEYTQPYLSPYIPNVKFEITTKDVLVSPDKKKSIFQKIKSKYF
jgi:cytoskeletal protein RodZ